MMTVKFYPAKFKNTYRHWMENVKDWCISRQLWWGQRIPAYYAADGSICRGKDCRRSSGNQLEKRYGLNH